MLIEGQRVEIAPYRGGRFHDGYRHMDGCRGVVVEHKGGKVRVNVESSHPGRNGELDVPVSALKALPKEGQAPTQ